MSEHDTLKTKTKWNINSKDKIKGMTMKGHLKLHLNIRYQFTAV